MSDLDRPRLALYVALALVVCVLGARYLVAQAQAPAPPRAGAGAGADGAQAGGTPDGTGASVSVERAGGGRVTVHVAGAVRRPGVYRLPAGARVDDALRSAGGPRDRADLTAVNLAAKLEDGRQVLVPERAAVAAGGGGAGAAAVPGTPRPGERAGRPERRSTSTPPRSSSSTRSTASGRGSRSGSSTTASSTAASAASRTWGRCRASAPSGSPR